MKKVAFESVIVQLTVKRLVSQDKSMRLTLEVDNPSDDLVNDLNELFKCGGAQVAVAVAEMSQDDG
jgi:hypothetical protein